MNRASLQPITNSSPLITSSAGVTSAGKGLLQRKLSIGASNDPLEHEADRVAGSVVSNQSAPVISAFNFGRIQREEKTGADPKEKIPKEKTNEEKYTEGAAKLGEAFLATPLGKQLIERLKQDALVKGVTQIGKDFIATWPGKIITGAAATGTITTLAATHKELPMQIPEIPLDFVTPGLSVKLTYNGPVDKPTDAMLTFKFTEQTPAAGSASKKLSASEQYRADTAKMAADQAKFRAGMITPGSPEDLQQKAEKEEMNKIAQKYAGGGPDIGAMIKKYPWLATPEPKTGLQLHTPNSQFSSGTGYQAPPIFGDQFKLNLSDEKKKKSDETSLQKKLSIGASNDPLEAEADRVADQVLANNSGTADINHSISSVQRHSTTNSEAAHDVPESVNQTLSGSGKPLDKTIRTTMESRFGHNFSQVRIHQGSTAEKSARDVNANAYTLGNNIVFGAGQYNPESQTGKRLLAHELTHVVQQQNNVIRPYRPSDAFNFGKLDTPTLKEDSFNTKKDKEKKPWVKKVDVSFGSTKKDAGGNNFWQGQAQVHYYDNPVKLPDFSFNVAGGSAELGKSDKGDFEVNRIEGVGYNSGSFSAPFKNSEREGPNKRYSKDLAANMSYAVFYNKGEALHAGPLDASSHGCVHVDWSNIQQLNYHSVIGLTKVSVAYP
jgi:hypothetical protein